MKIKEAQCSLAQWQNIEFILSTANGAGRRRRRSHSNALTSYPRSLVPKFASVIVPTHNRPAGILTTVRHLLDCQGDLPSEVLVVDDGSVPPLELPDQHGLRLIKTVGVERSAARNIGARAARGDLLIFVDDDITVPTDFIEQHARASVEFDNAMCVGRISLPSESSCSPFGRFRRSIEEPSQNRPRGVVAEPNFCTAANMSIRRSTFLSLGGFDPAILSGEDQDLALRFSSIGGRIAYLPDAEVIHRDSVTGIAAYGRRHEWGARALAPFLRRYPGRPENALRLGTATPLVRAQWPLEGGRILVKEILSIASVLEVLRGLIRVAETCRAGDRVLFLLYRTLLGLHLFRGFRAGLAAVASPPPVPQPLPAEARLPTQTD